MDKNKILDIMVAEHALIESLFVAYKDEVIQNPERANIFFAELVWEVKKHFFVEEQAIFNLLPWKDQEISEMVKFLKQDHFVIINILEKVLQKKESLSEVEKDGFTLLMKNHLEVEEKKLYPLLDEKLNTEEKKHIIARINQVPMENK